MARSKVRCYIGLRVKPTCAKRVARYSIRVDGEDVAVEV